MLESSIKCNCIADCNWISFIAIAQADQLFVRRDVKERLRKWEKEMKRQNMEEDNREKLREQKRRKETLWERNMKIGENVEKKRASEREVTERKWAIK